VQSDLMRLYGIKETYDIRVATEPIWVFKPDFAMATVLDALNGPDGCQTHIKGNIREQLVDGVVQPLNRGVEITLKSLERVSVRAGDLSSYPDWCFKGVCLSDEESREVVGYIRCNRRTGLPNLCLLILQSESYLLSVVGMWTGRKSAVLRYVMRMSTRQFARYLGISDRTVVKWEHDYEHQPPRTPAQDALNYTFLRLPETTRKVFWHIMTDAAVSGRASIESARELYPEYRIR